MAPRGRPSPRLAVVDAALPHPLMHRARLLRGMGAEGAGGGMLYGVGFVGAVIYYVQASTGFWMGVLGVLKALVWPAFLVYELLEHAGA